MEINVLLDTFRKYIVSIYFTCAISINGLIITDINRRIVSITITYILVTSFPLKLQNGYKKERTTSFELEKEILISNCKFIFTGMEGIKFLILFFE